MNYRLLLCLLLAFWGSPLQAQTTNLTPAQQRTVQSVISVFKTGDPSAIADLIVYPLNRPVPLKKIKDRQELLRRFEAVFDAPFVQQIGGSSLSDWSDMGWHGIMYQDGLLWLNEEGQIIAINYESAKEKSLAAQAIAEDKQTLPESLRDFKEPLYQIKTKSYRIRIDERNDGYYRYAVWSRRRPQTEPELLLQNGVLKFDGSGGNHTLTFRNGAYTYLVEIFRTGTAATPTARLKVLKKGRVVLSEKGDVLAP